MFAPAMAPISLLILLTSALSSAPASAMSRRQSASPILMGVMGDSISAGTLSDLPLKPFKKDEDPPPHNRPGTFPKNEIGAKLIYENKERLSWASGRSVISHFRLLKQRLKEMGDERRLEVANVSHPGDRTRGLPGQAKKLLEKFREGGYSSLIYVTILIGSNDACGEREATPLSRMRAELLLTFEKLAELHQSEPIRILLVGIPRIPDLGATAIKRTRTPVLGLRCSVIRDRLFGHCPNLLRWKSETEYDRAMVIVEERNRMLRSVAAEAHAAYPNLDVVYSNHLFDLEIPASMLAIDCFHPSKRGQQAISQEIWLDQPWF